MDQCIRSLILVSALCLIEACGKGGGKAGEGAWIATGSMTTARLGHTATLLANGQVLIMGGFGVEPGPLSSAEIYDLSGNGGRGSFRSTGSMGAARFLATATLLPGNKVLVAGGHAGGLSLVLATAELFDPAGNAGAGSFTGASNLSTPRAEATATLLPNGKVLIAGGTNPQGPLDSAEIYDPAGSGTFTPTGSMSTPRSGATATLLPSGKVLIVGGSGSPASAELFDPAGNSGLGSFGATGSAGAGRLGSTATLLSSGKVLIAGGVQLATAELYDPAGNGGVGSFSPTGSMAAQRWAATAMLLPSGRVIVAGGLGQNNIQGSAEQYDPSRDSGRGSFSSAGSLLTPREQATATLLSSGKVLVAGGGSTRPSGAVLPIDSAELYEPVAAGQ